MRYLVVIIALLCFWSCQEEMQPKPKAFLALEYSKAEYKKVDVGCAYTFEINTMAKVKPSRVNNPCWVDIEYPELNGTLFITYQEVNGNLDALLRDGQKLPLQHTKKADVIEGDQYLNPSHNTYGMFYEVEGNAASQAQFYVTDSINHFLTGAIYFRATPNFDSIYPAAAYLKNDIKQLMETVEWQD